MEVATAIMPRGAWLNIETLDIEAEENSSQITNLITGLELIRLEIEHTQGVNHWKGRIESHLGTEVESLLLHTQDALCAQCLA